MKEKHIAMYMEMAEVAAKSSYAKRLQVGSIAVKDHRILSVGYNGTPPGMDNDCEERDWDNGSGGWLSPEEIEQRYPFKAYNQTAGKAVRYGLKTKKEVIHAEMNLIYKMARDGQAGNGADIFITHAPCFECSKAILSVGFNSVYFRNAYRDSSGIDMLWQNGVQVRQV